MRARYTDLHNKIISRQQFIKNLHSAAEGFATCEDEKPYWHRFVEEVVMPSIDEQIKKQGLEP